MQFSELRELCSFWLDDLNFGYFTTTQVNRWLNNAQQELQKRLMKAGQNFYVKRVSTTLVVNQNDYVLPMDLKQIHRLDIVMSGTPPNESVVSLTPITWNQQDIIPTGTGTPEYYALIKNRIVVMRAPDTALTMRLSYSPLVAGMTNDQDVPDAPESYHQMIALLATEDGFIKDGRIPELLEKKITEYQKDIDSDANERRKDVSREIRDVSGSGSGFNF